MAAPEKGLTAREFENKYAVREIQSSPDEEYKKDALEYENAINTLTIKFYTDVYNLKDVAKITDDHILQVVKDISVDVNKRDKNPIQFFSDKYTNKHVDYLKRFFKLDPKYREAEKKSAGSIGLYATFMSYLGDIINPPKIDNEDRSTFDSLRFVKKMGSYFAMALLFFIMKMFFVSGMSVVMNDFIYKPPLLRLILGTWGGMLFFVTLVYYLLFRRKTVKEYAVFPLIAVEEERYFENDTLENIFGVHKKPYSIAWAFDYDEILETIPNIYYAGNPENPLPDGFTERYLRGINGLVTRLASATSATSDASSSSNRPYNGGNNGVINLTE